MSSKKAIQINPEYFSLKKNRSLKKNLARKNRKIKQENNKRKNY